jgi:hypothetical protein
MSDSANHQKCRKQPSQKPILDRSKEGKAHCGVHLIARDAQRE